jgi:peptidoglycan-associated lipoprotein
MKFGNARSMGVLALAAGLMLAVGCSSDDGPEGMDPGAGGGGGYEDLGTGVSGGDIAGRSAEGTEAARRMGLRTIYFDYDQSAIRSDARQALRNNFDILRQRSDVRVELQGNCDERGSSEYNFALGERRAKAVRDYLVQLGLSSGQMATVSFGEENPAVMGHGESAWSKNRRVDFAVLP